MAVPGTDTSITYNCNGAQVAFDIPFQFIKPTEILVERFDDTTGLFESLAYGSDYAVAGTTMTTVATYPTLDKLTIFRTTTKTQDTVLLENGQISAKVIEKDFDKGIMIDQENESQFGRAIRVAQSEPEVPPIPSIIRRAGKLLSFDTAGDPSVADKDLAFDGGTWDSIYESDQLLDGGAL